MILMKLVFSFFFFFCRYAFSRRILTGLVFSCIGDALLVWPNCFTAGMCMFAMAQIMYIIAFGFEPLNLKLGTILYMSCSVGEIHI